jgi:PIN domain nuclease of toxin-antitoxin system
VGGRAVKYLLDTSVWLRAVHEPDSIPAAHRRLLNSPSETFGLSAISLWEVAKKVQVGKLLLDKPLRLWFETHLTANMVLLPLDEDVMGDILTLQDFPNRDPADEIIVATARVYLLTLLTTDRLLRGYRHAKVNYFKPRQEG